MFPKGWRGYDAGNHMSFRMNFHKNCPSPKAVSPVAGAPSATALQGSRGRNPIGILPSPLAAACLAAGFALVLLMAGAGGSVAWAQEFAPQIGFVYPAGGQQGTTVEVTFGGRFLVKPTGVVVSGSGVRAVVIPSEPLLSGKQAADARGKLQELRKQRSPETREEIRKISGRLAAHERAKITPAIGERVRVRISIAKNAAPGNREARLVTATGLTNPLVFQVGRLPECHEPEPEREENWMRIQKSINDPDSRVKPGRNDKPPMDVTLPAIINGQLLPGEIDRFKFRARRGQRLFVDVSGRELLPYLADTVPGWLCAEISVLDAGGQELKPDDDGVQIRHDPSHRYAIPADGEYVLEIKDKLFRGREDFVYRIRIGGAETLQTAGRRLSAGGTPALPGPGGASALPGPGVTRGDDAVENEKEPNNSPDEAQAVTLPVVIGGRIDEPGDIDVFRFAGKAGECVVAEVFARRLGLDSPLDSMLIISDAAGNQIGFNDDHEDKGSGLDTHHADSFLAVTLPTDSAYYAHIGDTQQNGGEAYGYRLRIGPPQPDFALRTVPSTINIRANATQPITVHALRRDGFDGEIALALRNSAPGFMLNGGVIPAGQDKVQCTLTASGSPARTPVKLLLEGRAMIGGQAVVRAAAPAQEMMQAFAYQHLVPSEDLLVQVAGDFAPDSPAKILSALPVKIPANGTARVLFSVPRYSTRDAGQIQLLNPPEGITLKSFSTGRDRVELLLEADAAKVKPSLTGNLVAVFVPKDTTPPGAPKVNPERVPLGALPAVPFEIVGTQGRKK